MVGDKIIAAGVLGKFCSGKSMIFMLWTQSTIVFGNSEIFSTYWRGVHLWRSVPKYLLAAIRWHGHVDVNGYDEGNLVQVLANGYVSSPIWRFLEANILQKNVAEVRY